VTAAKYFSMPYRMARIPLGVLDSTVVQRLPERFPPRMMFNALVGTADLVAGRVLHDPDLQSAAMDRLHGSSVDRSSEPDGFADAAPEHPRPQQSRPQQSRPQQPRPQPAPSPEPPAEPQPAEVRQAARQARAADTKAKQRAATRANKNLATIRQQVAETEAIAEAREHIAEQGTETAEAAESAQLTDS
jgi:outer membrane biosynthesis protein TonB